MNKNIIIVGVLDSKESTNTSMAKSFIKFGFNVIPINYRSIISQYGMQFFENLTITTIKKYNPILTIFCKCNGVNPKLTKECTKLTKTWLWNPDPCKTIDRVPEVIEHMKNCSWHSHTAKGAKEIYDRRYNLFNSSYHIMCGLDYDLYLPAKFSNVYKAEVGFIGSKNKNRDRFLEIFKENKINAKFYGPGYTDYIDYKKFSQICSSSKFMFSVNNEQLTDYFSNRLLRYAGAGSCVLHYDPTETLDKYFKDREDILYFKSDEELIDLIKNTSDEDAGKIALNFREKVLKHYTWDNVIAKILEIVK